MERTSIFLALMASQLLLQNKQLKIVKILLDKGARIDQQHPCGANELDFARYCKYTAIAQLLEEHGAVSYLVLEDISEEHKVCTCLCIAVLLCLTSSYYICWFFSLPV